MNLSALENVKYITDQNGAPKEVIIPFRLWRELFKAETEKAENKKQIKKQDIIKFYGMWKGKKINNGVDYVNKLRESVFS